MLRNSCCAIPMDRPALQRLLADITAGRVDIVVVYRISTILAKSVSARVSRSIYPQPSRCGTKQERTPVSAGLNDGAQQGVSKGAQRGPVCCVLRNRGSVPGGGDALALAIWLCVPGLRRGASQFRQDPGALPVYRLSTADIRDRRNDFRGDQGAAVHVVSRHVPPAQP